MRYAIWLLMGMMMVGCEGEDVFTRPGNGTGVRPGGGTAVPAPNTPKIQFLSGPVRGVDTLGNVRYRGSLTNLGSAAANFVEVSCTSRDAAQAVLGVDRSFIVGRVVKLSSTEVNTNTGLDTGDEGFFEVVTRHSAAEVASFDCAIDFETFAATPPAARLENVGEPGVRSDFTGHVNIFGSVRNTGTQGLTFGEVFSITRNRAGEIIDISSSFIDGETVTLVSLGTTTDTALRPNATGLYEILTLAQFSEFASVSYLFDWSDSTITNGVASMLVQPATLNAVSPHESQAQRNERIRELRAQEAGR